MQPYVPHRGQRMIKTEPCAHELQPRAVTHAPYYLFPEGLAMSALIPLRQRKHTYTGVHRHQDRHEHFRGDGDGGTHHGFASERGSLGRAGVHAGHGRCNKLAFFGVSGGGCWAHGGEEWNKETPGVQEHGCPPDPY
eukprot:1159066-Pelagomonas_calceolata.AAC.10